MEPDQHLAAPLPPATLFTAIGKIATTVHRIDYASATLGPCLGCAPGSIAILTRNGIRLFGTLAQDDDGTVRFAFDDPLPDWQHDRFVGRVATRRPIVIEERLAA